MVRNILRPRALLGTGFILLATAIGCVGADHSGRKSEWGDHTIEELRGSAGWYDLKAQDAVQEVIRPEDLFAFAKQARAARKPAVPVTPKSILILTGGGSYGAYPAGVLVGWSESGTRPVFDVVTGTSTGALIGCFAFLGQAYDAELRRFYTTMSNDDLYRKRRFPTSILSDSIADDAPLANLISRAITDDRMRAMGEEYRKGRRLYVGTSDLENRRAVVWDITAIAARDTPGDRELIRNILLASTAIPSFFPPVKIPVFVDGVRHVEHHVDGVTSSSMCFAPPYVPPEERPTLPAGWLYNTDMYILVAGKLYADPAPVKARTFSILSQAISTVLYDQTRADLHRMFLLSILTGMNYYVSSIPEDMPVPKSATDFKPCEMSRMFEAGAAWARQNRKWRETPPGYEPGEGPYYRAGTILTNVGTRMEASLDSGVMVPSSPVAPAK